MNNDMWDWNQELKTCDCGIAKLAGLVELLCPVCSAHLAKSGICLNACHLGEDGQKRFQEKISQFMNK